ncbi:VCBS repeat-containing protein [Dysgonomonas sp. 216]|uniref:FG-GAP repeat domain-containing protein n=1 Tax=Dysgonomonas sp. 216 TaxID=2302934 RepID=UPI0013D79672|nr:VCBS repeat-containing protein [Dysgonomonas sp. 216]NDW18837.1 VCBS repeat-containing protein [Dysgonomonas sp. 216]
MKNSTFLKKLVGTALSLAVACGVTAQEYCTFTPSTGSWYDIEPFIGSYRSNPVFFDYNNDGLLDIYYGGQGLPDEGTQQKELYDQWRPFSNMMKQNADGTFTPLLGISPYAPVAEGTEIPSPVGLPLNSMSCYAAFDYNNDGYTDILVYSDKEWGVDNPFCQLYKNLGPDHDYKFEIVPEAIFRQGAPGQSNELKSYQAVATGDYDKDGFTDVLIIGIDEISRYVELYKNNGDGTFTAVRNVTLKNPVFIGNEHIEDYAGFRPMSKGSVVFADLDNDGWLDIISNGYTDGSPEGYEPAVSGGGRMAIYRNMQDGSFEEMTPDDLDIFIYDGEIKVGDFKNNGFLDIFISGEGRGEEDDDRKQAFLLENEGTWEFNVVDHNELGIRGVKETHVVLGDLNNDGLLDVITTGWPTNPDGDKVTCLYYQKSNGAFLLDDVYPLLNANESGLALGDANGDNTLDVFITGYKRNNEDKGSVFGGTPAILHINQVGEGVPANTPPSAPANVAANYADGVLSITWDAADDDISPVEALVYNVYVKNENTGEIFSLIPADIATGKLRAIASVHVGTRVLNYSMKTTMDLASVKYTIGVQAIDQSYAGGAFATVEMGNGSSINPDEVASANVVVKVVADGILVEADSNDAVVVVDLSGRIVAQGYTNKVVPVASQGVYMVSVGGKTYKVVK